MLIAQLDKFLAANAKQNPKDLDAGIGVDARNLWTEEGDFQGIKGASQVHTLASVVGQQLSIYRMGRDAPSDTAYWLAYTTDVDWARSMLADDSSERTIYTGDGVPKVTDNTFLGAPPYPTGYRNLGVPAPSGNITLAIGTPGTGSSQTRTYLDTFVTDKGEESAPNANPQSITCNTDASINLSTLPAVPGGPTGITLRWIYVSTGDDFKRVLEQNASLTTATDAGTSRGAVLQTGGATSRPTWLQPPAGLKGITELWKGMHGGFFGKAYCACVPFKNWAWPLEYQKQVPDTIVGSGTWGENWILLTTGLPRLVVGSSPASLSDQPIYLGKACVSKRSVRSVKHGVCWASNDGLCYHGQLGTMVLTEPFIRRAAWRALHPETIIGACWGRYYIGFFDDGVSKKGFMIDTVQPTGVVWLDQGAYGVFHDTISESLYLLDASNAIRKWDSGAALSATYKSKVFRHPYETNAGAAMVVATTFPVTFTLWALLRTSPSDPTAVAWTQIDTRMVSGPEPFQLPGGYLAHEFQVQIQGAGPGEGVLLAEDIDDLV